MERRTRRSGRLTLRQRLTASMLTVGLASTFLAVSVYVVFDIWTFRALILQRLEIRADEVASLYLANREGIDSSQLPLLDVPQDDPYVRGVQVVDTRGALRAWDRAADSRCPYVEGGIFGLVVRRELKDGGRPAGAVLVRGNPDRVIKRVCNHLVVLGGLVCLSLFITRTLIRRVHSRFSDQILNLIHAANRISVKKDYSIRAIRGGDEEIGILVDTFNYMITQVQLHESQLRSEVKRAEAAKAAKAQFLATMSHEIRTPINGILGMTELMMDTELRPDQTEFAETIRLSAEGLLAIINDILDFSKAEAGRLEVEKIRFDLPSVLNECLDTVAILAAEKGIELCSDVEGSISTNLIGDPTRLRQVVLNLLSNALKFTNEGEIILHVAVEEAHDSSVIRFEVRDTGIGIPEDRMNRLFKSFSQVDAGTNRKYGGSGLGLAICKQIIEAMGGKMFVRTKEGVGSTFGFRVPFEIDGSAPVSDADIGPRDLKILAADANETTREILERWLEKGNDITVAESGESAREEVLAAKGSDAPFDLLLIDHRLLDGLLGESEEDAAEIDLSLIVLAPVTELTALSSERVKGRFTSLAKPAHREALYWCIAEMLRDPDLPRPALPATIERRRRGRPTGDEGLGDVSGLVGPPADLRVLVVEDNLVNQKITTSFLDKIGVTWTIAQNGEEAVEAARKLKFDVILMDIQMPVMDGLEAMQTIRNMESGENRGAPIIAMTANVLDEDQVLYEQSGFDDQLGKPFKCEQLERLLARWIGPEGRGRSRGPDSSIAGADLYGTPQGRTPY